MPWFPPDLALDPPECQFYTVWPFDEERAGGVRCNPEGVKAPWSGMSSGVASMLPMGRTSSSYK